ncbi:MAG: hypothetical protein FWF10_00600 [Clostridiales bacterium]|nr:hypothetical protein [Clostridiales bacterium]
MFANYPFYKANGGRLPEDRYKAFISKAYNAILSQTRGAAKTAPASMKNALKLCECDLVDLLAGYAESAAELPGNIKSVHNDGYIVTAESGSSAESVGSDIHVICARYLTSPVNLMCRWL